MRSLAATLGLAVCLAATAVAPAVAPASTISGRLVDGKLPAKGKGVASVRAVSTATFAIVASERVSRRRFSLKLPAGAYVLLGATTPFRGKAGVDRLLGSAKLRTGAKRTLRLSLKPKKRKLKIPKKVKVPQIRLPTASAAYVNVDYPSVWIKRFAVSGPSDFRVLSRGIADMLTTDVIPDLEAQCNGIVVERERFDTILAELALSQSGLVDPSVRLQPNKIIAHNKEVSGTITVSADTMTVTAVVTDVLSHKSRSVTRSGPSDDFFEIERRLAPEIVRLLCGDKPPARYTGTVGGSIVSPEQTQRWSGNVVLRYDGIGPGGPGTPEGKYALYVVESGSLHFTLDGTNGECTYHGETDTPVAMQPGEWTTVEQDVDDRSYTILHRLSDGASVPYTSTGPAYCSSSGNFPLGGRVFVSTLDAQTSAAAALSGSVTVNVGVPVTWSWALEPSTESAAARATLP